jgi:hypothetical protein
MTEDEAKTKWCPNVRVNVGTHQTGNRLGAMANGVDSRLACIGSACMAWRSYDIVEDRETECISLAKPRGELNPPFSNCPDGFSVTRHDSDGYYDAISPRKVTRHGFCGAFGAPR